MTPFQQEVQEHRSRGRSDASVVLADKGRDFAEAHFRSHCNAGSAAEYGYWSGFLARVIEGR